MTKYSFILFFIVLFLWGCEKIIDVDLNETDPKLVIEANLSNSLRHAEVKLSKTGSYFSTEPVQKISDAVISLEGSSGNHYQLAEEEDGTYLLEDVVFETGATYKITVEAEGGVYEAESVLPERVRIDSLAAVYNDEISILNKGYHVNLYFHDPAEIQNYYRLKIFVNGEPDDESDDFIFFDDENMDGEFIQLRVRSRTFELGDTVTYELISVDKGAYLYFTSLEEVISVNPGSAAPSNPPSNFSNGALGYFSAWSSDRERIIIKK